MEPTKRRVLLTHKKTMVKSSLPFLASYAQPKLGMWIHGCVVAVKDFGCIVSFYNDVKGQIFLIAFVLPVFVSYLKASFKNVKSEMHDPTCYQCL